MRRLYRLTFRLLLTLLALALVMGLGAFLFPQRILTIDSGNMPGDVIVVLGGGTDQKRPEQAAELYRQGRAPIVLISGTGDDALTERLLKRNGVPATAIKVEGTSQSTLENARFSVEILRQMGARRVIIVTSWYHSRRALACFQQAAPELTFYSCPSYWGYARKDWDVQDMRGHIRNEYIKILGYWICYGICPVGLR